MEQCFDCGKPCGRRHAVSWMNNEDFLCDSCFNKRQTSAVKAFGGFLFLVFAVGLSWVVSLTVLKPIAAASGYDTAKSVAVGLGIGGVILFFILRYVAGRTAGCLFRMVVKLVGFLAYALGVGLLFLTFLMEDQLKDIVAVKDSNGNAAAEEVGHQ